MFYSLLIMASAAWQTRRLAWIALYGSFAINLLLDAWLLTVLHKRDVRKHLPWFVLYIAWEFLSTAVGLITWIANRQLYAAVYWWKEAARMILLVAAVRESLLRLFEDFKALLRWSVSAVVLLVVAYSAWKATYAPAIQSTRLGSFILAAEFTFRWAIVAVAALSAVLMRFIDEPAGSREDAVLTGCGIASLGVVAHVLSRSFFGTRYTLFTQYLPDVGYFIAVLLWIRVFRRPEGEFGFQQLGLGPGDIRKELRRFRELDQHIARKER